MLAIQKIFIRWTKSDRTPEGAAERQRFIRPQRLDDPICSEGNGYFINEHDYIQLGKIYTVFDAVDKLKESAAHPIGYIETAEAKRRSLLERNKRAAVMNGRFTDDIHIPGITVLDENNSFRVRWHSLDSCYRPIRNGHNEEYNDRSSPFCGKNITNETAFVLHEGEAGMVDYNYRYTHESQHYERYVVYFVNTPALSANTFTAADYIYRYDQTAVLF